MEPKPEVRASTTLYRALASGDAHPPAEHGTPDLIPELAPDLESLSAFLHEERDMERRSS